MPTPIKIIHNVETNEIVEREMTADELVQWEADKEAARLEKQATEDAIAAKAAAEAKLTALGLTTDDLKALGLG